MQPARVRARHHVATQRHDAAVEIPDLVLRPERQLPRDLVFGEPGALDALPVRQETQVATDLQGAIRRLARRFR